jgi:hypothetical protein
MIVRAVDVQGSWFLNVAWVMIAYVIDGALTTLRFKKRRGKGRGNKNCICCEGAVSLVTRGQSLAGTWVIRRSHSWQSLLWVVTLHSKETKTQKLVTSGT